MRKFVLVLMLAMLMTSAAWAQTCIVGHTNLTPVSTNLPWYHLYDYSETQYVIPAADMAMCFPGPDPVTISSIGWYYVSGTLPSTTQYSLNIYLNETTAGGGTVCTTRIANGTLVASGKTLPAGTAPTALYITLDTQFTYNPGNDLVVTVCDTLAGWTSGAGFAANALAGDGGQLYRDGTAYDCDALTNDGGSSACRGYWPTTCFGYVGAASTLTMLAPGGLGTGTVSPAVGTTTYSVGGTANIVATPAFGSVFDYWEVDGVYYSDLASDTLIMDTDHTVQAFFDLASPAAMPMCENFDGTWSGSPAAPTGWLVIDADLDTYTWNQDNIYISPTHSEPYAAHGMGNQNDWLISPLVGIPAGVDAEIVWWDRVESATYNNTYDVLISTTGYAIGDFTSLGTYNCINTAWTEHTIALNAYAGMNVYIAFHQTFSGSTYWGFGIDDVCVREQPTYVSFTMDAPGGIGTVNPWVGTSNQIQGTTLNIFAAPGLGQDFVEWYVDGSPYSTTEDISLLMDGPHSAQAFFAPETDLRHDNGLLVTTPGGGAAAADISELQGGLGMTTWGTSASQATGYALADDFVVPSTESWNPSRMTFYTYQTGSTTTSTITGLFVQIWDGDPTAGATVIWGDLTTNVMTATGWTGAYRLSEGSPTNTQRPIMYAYCDVSGLNLTPGTYWVEYQFTGSLASGPWVPAVTVIGQTTTGNAKQHNVTGATWADFIDVGGQGAPFVVHGTLGAPPNAIYLTPSTSNASGLADQTVTHTLVLDNQSGISDTFNLAITGQTWTTTITSANPVTIADGATATVTVQVLIPTGSVPPAADTCTLTATGQTSALTDSSTLNTAADDPNLVCDDPDTSFSQPYEGQTNAYSSSVEAGYYAADDFFGLTSPILGVDFWGLEIDPSTWTQCAHSLNYVISFYDDNAGVPGTQVYTETVTVSEIATSELDPFIGTIVYKYHADLAAPVNMTSGWISIAGGDDANGCMMFWPNSFGPATGYVPVQDVGAGWVAITDNNDLAFCLIGETVVPTATPTTGPTPTMGPVPTTGPAGIGLLLVAIGALMSLAGLRRK